MSQSIFLTIFFRQFNKIEWDNTLVTAKKIFREVWPTLGTGFDELGNINGLKELYCQWEYNSDADELSKENGALTILDLNQPDIEENVSFNFHNYGADLELPSGFDFRDIYVVIAHIISKIHDGCIIQVSDAYPHEKYSFILNEDSRIFRLTNDSSKFDIIDEIIHRVNLERELEDAEQKVKNAKDKLATIKSKEVKSDS